MTLEVPSYQLPFASVCESMSYVALMVIVETVKKHTLMEGRDGSHKKGPITWQKECESFSGLNRLMKE